MLLDTSGLLCLHNRAEPFHEQARTLYRAARVRLTDSYVLAEFVALANARRLPCVAALTFVVDLVENPDIETVTNARLVCPEKSSSADRCKSGRGNCQEATSQAPSASG
jgi:predicted nucleic acid-binding protein